MTSPASKINVGDSLHNAPANGINPFFSVQEKVKEDVRVMKSGQEEIFMERRGSLTSLGRF